MASQRLRQGVALLGVSVVLATIAMHVSREHRLELVDITAPGYYITRGNLGSQTVQKSIKRPVITFGHTYNTYFDNEQRRTKREAAHDVGRDAHELDVRPHRAVPEITFDKEAIKTTRNSASQSTIDKWKNYKQKQEAEKLVDPCKQPGSMCSLIKHLNSEHLGGVINVGGEAWNPGAQAKEEARTQGMATHARSDPSLCDICISHALADSGPARFIDGRTIERQARKGTCAPLCSP